MEPFTYSGGIAAPLPLANIDTDKILPARFLKTITRVGLGSALFDTMRFDDDGADRPDFILNRPPWRDATTLVALDNFGCGSSREHAPWALADFGFRVIIAPGFADIFYNNCFKNGLLPIALDADIVRKVLDIVATPATATIAVDLPGQTVSGAWGTISFPIAPDRKRALLLGLDDIAQTEKRDADITLFEQRRRYVSPAIHFG